MALYQLLPTCDYRSEVPYELYESRHYLLWYNWFRGGLSFKNLPLTLGSPWERPLTTATFKRNGNQRIRFTNNGRECVPGALGSVVEP